MIQTLRSILGDLARRARGLGLLTLAIWFALIGQAVGAGLLSALDALRLVDFSAVDASRAAVFYALLALFFLQAALVFVGVAKSGIRVVNVAAGLSSLLWALSMLMIHYVALQCSLYGECL
jgi:hypothetical protein